MKGGTIDAKWIQFDYLNGEWKSGRMGNNEKWI